MKSSTFAKVLQQQQLQQQRRVNNPLMINYIVKVKNEFHKKFDQFKNNYRFSTTAQVATKSDYPLT